MNRGLLPGLVIALLGVLLILHNFRIFSIWNLQRFWPLLLIALGLSRILDSARNTRVVGAGLVAAGVILQLSNLGLLHLSIRGLLRFWPLAIVALGLQLLSEQRKRGGVLGGVFVLALGVILQFQTLGWIELDVWRLWPVILIVLGILMIQKAMGRAPRMR